MGALSCGGIYGAALVTTCQRRGTGGNGGRNGWLYSHRYLNSRDSF